MANEPSTEVMDRETGEVMTVMESATPLAVAMAQAELNQAVTTAKAFPRSITQAVERIMTLATLDEESAAECVYALPRGGKPIKGPSVRFAEIVASQWGNCHTGSRVVAVDKFDKVVIAEGVFLDLETGMKRTAQIRRRIVDSKGRLYNDDMITVTGNAAASIAMREAILKGIPKAVWRKAYVRCEGVIAGDVKTLNVRRDDAIKAFAVWGVKPEQIFAALEVGGLDDIGLDELGTLTAMHKAIKSGEETVERYFPARADGAAAVEAAKGTAGKLADIAAGAKKDDAKPAEGDGKAKPKATKAADKSADAKPEDETKPESQQAAPQTAEAGAVAQDSQNGASAAGEANSSASAAKGEEEEESFSAEEIDAAFDRGAEAAKKGMSRKATPPEWREPGKEPLLTAYLQGFDKAKADAGNS